MTALNKKRKAVLITGEYRTFDIAVKGMGFIVGCAVKKSRTFTPFQYALSCSASNAVINVIAQDSRDHEQRHQDGEIEPVTCCSAGGSERTSDEQERVAR